jgi:hypothetical protein
MIAIEIDEHQHKHKDHYLKGNEKNREEQMYEAAKVEKLFIIRLNPDYYVDIKMIKHYPMLEYQQPSYIPKYNINEVHRLMCICHIIWEILNNDDIHEICKEKINVIKLFYNDYDGLCDMPNDQIHKNDTKIKIDLDSILKSN